MTSDSTAEQVYPIGQLIGVRAVVDQFDIRVGAALHSLTSAEFGVWAMAHGPADHVPRPWTPDALAAQAEAVGLADCAQRLDRLQEQGLVALAAPGTGSARDLARRVRMVPLVLGLGNSAAAPDAYAVGLPGRPLAVLSAAAYDLFEWAHMESSLWRACEGAAATAARVGIDDALATDPDALLTSLLEDLHRLLTPNAVHLDTWAVS
ncbi:hypothetical protein GCM10023328_02410 [Modestobacter marinus]|uniref:Uncharacterized protein n=1 Tax=Modestobacter marinus TaxID=477641 RepID=A0A846LGP2_9ACTN|nr:hypothetical protein [Modestobacter marinus]NIH67333.1 hypothetical protein [Modestobacter marinus]GGL54020.1 hypothetical protein GCM10011589_07550 [Modestobacter marinus]